MSKPQPPNHDMTFCVSDWCEARHDCARHVSHYEFDRGLVYLADFTNLEDECEHHIPKEKTS